jgi:ABC-type sugar transport system ATPase subunit
MAKLQLNNLTKHFDNITAINALDLEIDDGEFFCILGPPGAGKTTLLRLIVGLETADEGDIKIEEKSVNGVHPSKRDMAMIFQNLALYPDKTIFSNMAFPLQQAKVNPAEIKKKVNDVAKLLKIDWLLHKLPSQLSGGEKQRVAIGRAIVRKPKVYLMDEPLSNLDALLRLEMRVGLKDLQTRLKETFVYVTHDQDEAMSLGDRLMILNKGVIQQIADPMTIYKKPNNIFVATILGNPPMNLMNCTLNRINGKIQIQHLNFTIEIATSDISSELITKMKRDEIILGIRPEDIKIELEQPDTPSISAQVYITEPLGNETIVDAQIEEDIIKVLVEPDFSAELNQNIWLTFNSSKIHLFDPITEKYIFHSSEDVQVHFSNNSD